METKKSRRAKGEGTVDAMPDGRFRARVNFGVDMLGKRVRKSVYGKTKDEVLNKLRALQQDKFDGIIRPGSSSCVADFMKMWLEDIARPSISPKTYAGYESTIRLHINPHIGKFEITKLKPVQIQALYGLLERNGLGKRAREMVHVTLTTALKRAVRLELIQRNPVELVDKPKYKRGEVRALTLEEVEELLAAAQGDRLLNYYIVAITTGMRPGEQAVLKWNDIDFKQRRLGVRRKINYANRKVYIGPPKTEAGRRRLDLTDRGYDALQAQKQQLKAEGLGKSEWVFPELDGEPLRVYFGLTRFDDLVERKTKIGKLRLYDLRHTFATLALAAGIPLKVVSEMLGHASIQITADTYQHVIPSMQREAVTRLNDYFTVAGEVIGDKVGDQDSGEWLQELKKP